MFDPDLNARHLFNKAAPCSSIISSLDPAFGYVIVTVLVLLEASVTTFKPLGRVVTDAEGAFAGVGFKEGSLLDEEMIDGVTMKIS